MLLTLYPNYELRARIAAPVPAQRAARGGRFCMAGVQYLSIVENLRQEFGERPFKQKPLDRIRPGYGHAPRSRPFSVRARRLIARCGGAFGSRGGRECTLFLTGTLPGSTQESFAAISKWSAWIVHELVTCIPRLAGVKPSECDYLWVWEFQKRGALHWHGVFEFNSRVEARKVHEKFKLLWIRIIRTVGRFAGTDMARKNEFVTHRDNTKIWRTRSEYARKNPARYLAKYVAKAKAAAGLDGHAYWPSRWYSICRSLLRKASEATLYASVSSEPSSDHSKVGDVEIEVLERLFGLASTVKHFPDKVRSGYTFVFYFSEENQPKAREIMREFEDGELEDYMRFGSTSRRIYYGLRECGAHPYLMERFLNDVGPYYRAVYTSWVNGQQIRDDDLYWLDHYAHQILHRAGLSYRGQPPERSVAGLPGQGAATMDPPTPPCEDFDQPSLFP